MSVFASGRQMQPRSRLIFGRSVPVGTCSVGLRSEAQSDQTIARERNATERKAERINFLGKNKSPLGG